MKINLIAAIGKCNEIGNNNQLLWHLPSDFAWFKTHTINKTIVMGRKTHESIGFLLPKRRNIILTHQENYFVKNAEIMHSLCEVLEKTKDENEIFIIGGEKIYQLFFPFANQLYITFVDYKFIADAYFPEINLNEWELVYQKKSKKDEKHQYDFCFCIFDKI